MFAGLNLFGRQIMTLKNFILTAFLAVMTACNPGVFVNDIGPSAKELTFNASGGTKEIRFQSRDWELSEVRDGTVPLTTTVYPDNMEPFTTTSPKLKGTGKIIVFLGDKSEWTIARPSASSLVITSCRNTTPDSKCFNIILTCNGLQETITIFQKSLPEIENTISACIDGHGGTPAPDENPYRL